MPLTPVYLPKYGMTMTEALIVAWLVREGDPVQEGQPLVSIETEKVNSAVEAPVSGRLVEICFGEEDSPVVGAILAYIETDESSGGG